MNLKQIVNYNIILPPGSKEVKPSFACVHTQLHTQSQSCLTLCNPMNCSPPGFSVHGILQARILEWIAIPFCRGFSRPGIEPRSPALQVDSFPAAPPGKPKNTGVGSLSLFQWIFPMQESNWSLLHYRQILYQLSYQGSPINFEQ